MGHCCWTKCCIFGCCFLKVFIMKQRVLVYLSRHSIDSSIPRIAEFTEVITEGKTVFDGHSLRWQIEHSVSCKSSRLRYKMTWISLAQPHVYIGFALEFGASTCWLAFCHAINKRIYCTTATTPLHPAPQFLMWRWGHRPPLSPLAFLLGYSSSCPQGLNLCDALCEIRRMPVSSSFVTKWGSRMLRERFDLASPNFRGTFIPTGTIATSDMTK